MLGLEEASGSSNTEIADAVRTHSGGEEQVLGELKELHQRILFTILVNNNDDHMKNPRSSAPSSIAPILGSLITPHLSWNFDSPSL